MTLRALALTGLLVALLAAPAGAADFTVTANHDEGDGACLDVPSDCTLRDALTQAGPSDRVLLPGDTYELAHGQLQLDGDTIVGVQGSRVTRIEAANGERGIYIASGSTGSRA